MHRAWSPPFNASTLSRECLVTICELLKRRVSFVGCSVVLGRTALGGIETLLHFCRQTLRTVASETKFATRMLNHYDARKPAKLVSDLSDVFGRHVNHLQLLVKRLVETVRRKGDTEVRHENGAANPQAALLSLEPIDSPQRYGRNDVV